MPKPIRQDLIDIDSLARGDSHMIARFNDAWAAAVAERATWPLPWDADYEERAAEASIQAVSRAAAMLGVLSDAWTTHLLYQAGVGPHDRPPPTSSQTRKLWRLLESGVRSDDDGEQVLATWASYLLNGEVDALRGELMRLAGAMRADIVLSVLNHVREVSPQYNGKPLVAIDPEPDPPTTDDPEVDSLINKIVKGDADA